MTCGVSFTTLSTRSWPRHFAVNGAGGLVVAIDAEGASVGGAGGGVDDFSIGSPSGAGPGVFRWKEAEVALGKSFTKQAVAGLAVKADGLNADIHAPAEYRANLVKVMCERAVQSIAG